MLCQLFKTLGCKVPGAVFRLDNYILEDVKSEYVFNINLSIYSSTARTKVQCKPFNNKELYAILASQVSDSLTLIYPLADLASVYMLCPEIPKASYQIAPSKQHGNDMTAVSQL